MKTLFLATCVAFSSLCIAQDGEGIPPGRRDEIRSQKIAFITSQLELTPEESMKFWPVYNQYEKELDAQRKQSREAFREARELGSEISERDLDEAMANRFSEERARINIEESYYAKFKAVLPIQKVARLYKAEKDFKRELLRNIRERKQNQGQ